MEMRDIMTAQREEMLRHKWIESEKAGHDLGDAVIMELPEGGKAVYFGIFLDDESRERLIERLRGAVPSSWEFKCERCTLAFGDPYYFPRVKEYIAANLGKRVELYVTSIGVAVDVIAVGVEGSFVSAIERPHIPVAVPQGGHSKNSNYITTWEHYVPDMPPLTGIVDTFPRLYP